MSKSIIKEKSFAFAVRIVNLFKFLKEKKKESVLGMQILRSGTSIGANVREAMQAESKADFIHKLHIALKETAETGYWLELLLAGEFITKNQFDSLNRDCEELLKILTAIIKTTKSKKLSTLNS